jgi:hypothetical protein
MSGREERWHWREGLTSPAAQAIEGGVEEEERRRRGMALRGRHAGVGPQPSGPAWPIGCTKSSAEHLDLVLTWPFPLLPQR